MGYMKHHAIVVTHWETGKVKEAHEKATEIFKSRFKKVFGISDGDLVSPIISGVVNSQDSFFIAPDGSKEGWEDSNAGNDARKEFLDWLQNSKDNYCDYVEIEFGGDSNMDEVIRSKHTDLEQEDYH